VAENRFNHDHLIKLQDTKIIFIKSSYLNQLLREATELEIQPHSMNRDDALTLSRSWRLLVWPLRESTWSSQEWWLAHVPSEDHTLLAPLPWNNGSFFSSSAFHRNLWQPFLLSSSPPSWFQFYSLAINPLAPTPPLTQWSFSSMYSCPHPHVACMLTIYPSTSFLICSDSFFSPFFLPPFSLFS